MRKGVWGERMKCDCRRWPTRTFMGETTCTKCGEPTTKHINKLLLTNDGATILKNLEMKDPVGKLIIEVAKAQEDSQ